MSIVIKQGNFMPAKLNHFTVTDNKHSVFLSNQHILSFFANWSHVFCPCQAVCKSKKSWQARHTGIKIVQQIAILMGCAILPHLKSLVEIIEHGECWSVQQEASTSCCTNFWPWKLSKVKNYAIFAKKGNIYLFVLHSTIHLRLRNKYCGLLVF